MANVLSDDKKAAVLAALVEGNSLRATSRMTGVHRTTITNLMLRVGQGCASMMDEKIRGLSCESVQVDEIWTFNYCKQRRVGHTKADPKPQHGDQWVFVALDADTKLVPCYSVGKRTWSRARWFLQDLSDRIESRFQLTTDGWPGYDPAARYLSRQRKIDYATQVKHYVGTDSGFGRYSPPRVCAISSTVRQGDPDPEAISTSYVERNNLTIRMQMRRFTRLTNAFSKKVENLRAAVALHFAAYNFCRFHGSLGVTPAMAAGVTCVPWEVSDLLRYEKPY